MTKRIPMNTAAEYDAFSRKWRHLLCYLQRAGARDSIKRNFRRRERRTAKQDIREGRE